MNLEQLGTGKLNVGYFFLLASLAGVLSFGLTRTVQPLEAAWLRARRRFVLRELRDDDKDLVASITKRQISYAFLRRHFPPAKTVYDRWEYTKNILSDELGGPYGDPEEVPVFSTVWYICHNSTRSLAQMIWKLRPLVVKRASEATQDVLET
jgi:hypothetical protein